jgi:hypothetical protein
MRIAAVGMVVFTAVMVAGCGGAPREAATDAVQTGPAKPMPQLAIGGADRIAAEATPLGRTSVQGAVGHDSVNVYRFACSSEGDYDLVTCERVGTSGDPDLFLYQNFSSSGKPGSVWGPSLIGKSTLAGAGIDWFPLEVSSYANERILAFIYGYGMGTSTFRLQHDVVRKITGVWSAQHTLTAATEMDWWHVKVPYNQTARVEVRITDPTAGRARLQIWEDDSSHFIVGTGGRNPKVSFASESSYSEYFVRVVPVSAGTIKYKIRWVQTS